MLIVQCYSVMAFRVNAVRPVRFVQQPSRGALHAVVAAEEAEDPPSGAASLEEKMASWEATEEEQRKASEALARERAQVPSWISGKHGLDCPADAKNPGDRVRIATAVWQWKALRQFTTASRTPLTHFESWLALVGRTVKRNDFSTPMIATTDTACGLCVSVH